jgi:hypothetical protein
MNPIRISKFFIIPYIITLQAHCHLHFATCRPNCRPAVNLWGDVKRRQHGRLTSKRLANIWTLGDGCLLEHCAVHSIQVGRRFRDVYSLQQRATFQKASTFISVAVRPWSLTIRSLPSVFWYEYKSERHKWQLLNPLYLRPSSKVLVARHPNHWKLASISSNGRHFGTFKTKCPEYKKFTNYCQQPDDNVKSNLWGRWLLSPSLYVICNTCKFDKLCPVCKNEILRNIWEFW